MNPFVKSVRPLDDYFLELEFENGERRLFDVKMFMEHGVFAQLSDPAEFARIKVEAGSIEWACGPDLSYDTLYLESQPVSSTQSCEEKTKV